LIETFCESGVEGSGKEGAGGRQEFFVDKVGDGWAGDILLVADDHGGHCTECAEGCTEGHFRRRAAWTRARDWWPCSGSSTLMGRFRGRRERWRRLLRCWDAIDGHGHSWRYGGRPDTGERSYRLVLWCSRYRREVAEPNGLFWRIQLDLCGSDMLLGW
jgi:hypothetical protein